MTKSDNYPRCPLYIPSKGRSGYMMTSKALTRQGVKHYIVVEPQEVAEYKKSVRAMNLSAEILELDMSYKERYELCDNLGLTRSTGPGPARNFAWDHAKSNGHEYHWVMDDNIRHFYRFNKNEKRICLSPGMWRAMEDFCTRYENVLMAGPNYMFFAKQRQKLPPFIKNTRIYSCNLIRNDAPFRWRGRYNEDTILSLDMLSAGYCTIQFNTFLQGKIVTQSIGGGNTAEFYHAEGQVKNGEKYADTGTLAKSQMMVTVYPQYSRVVKKFGRIHHHVDYRPFRKNKLIKRNDIEITKAKEEYGMVLK